MSITISMLQKRWDVVKTYLIISYHHSGCIWLTLCDIALGWSRLDCRPVNKKNIMPVMLGMFSL